MTGRMIKVMETKEGTHHARFCRLFQQITLSSLNFITSLGTSALYWAVKEKKYNFTEALLKAGAKPSPRLKKDGSTPLHISAFYKAKDLDIAQVLMQYGADVNARLVN